MVEPTSKIVLTIVWKFSVRPDMNDEFKSGLQSLILYFDCSLESLVLIFSKLYKKKEGNILCKTEFKIGVVTEILWSYLKVLMYWFKVSLLRTWRLPGKKCIKVALGNIHNYMTSDTYVLAFLTYKVCTVDSRFSDTYGLCKNCH